MAPTGRPGLPRGSPIFPASTVLGQCDSWTVSEQSFNLHSSSSGKSEDKFSSSAAPPWCSLLCTSRTCRGRSSTHITCADWIPVTLRGLHFLVHESTAGLTHTLVAMGKSTLSLTAGGYRAVLSGIYPPRAPRQNCTRNRYLIDILPWRNIVPECRQFSFRGGGLAALEHPQKGGGQRGSRGDQKLTFPFCCKLISIPKVITSKNFRGLAVLQYPTKMRGRAKGSGGALKRGLQMHMTIIPLYICINTYVRMYIYMKNAYL